MQIRVFKESDGDKVGELISSIMRNEFGMESRAYPENDLNDIPRCYGGKRDAFFVVEQDKKIIGTVAIKEEDTGVALLRRLFVHPEYRKQGCGLKLIEAAIDFCKRQRYRVIVFRSTGRMSRANSLCKRMGFLERARVNFDGFQILKFTLNCSPSMSKPR